LREVAAAVACAVARQAQLDGVADFTDAAGIEARVKDYMWEPRYRPYSKS
jgi:malate dehydrogenase (oxaloacetate-decarboxylating)